MLVRVYARSMLRSSTRKAAFLAPALVIGAMLLAAGPAAADVNQYAPSCVKPGGRTVADLTFSTTPGQGLVSEQVTFQPSVFRGEDGVEGFDNETFNVKSPMLPMTNTPDPTIKGYFIPSFKQAVEVPKAAKVDGAPIVSYYAYTNPFDGKGQAYSQSNTYQTIWIDGKRAFAAKSVGNKSFYEVTVAVFGFGPRAKLYAHVIAPGGKVLKNVKLGRSSGENTCGQWFPRVSFKGAKTGTGRIVINTSAKSTSAKGGAMTTIKVNKK